MGGWKNENLLGPTKRFGYQHLRMSCSLVHVCFLLVFFFFMLLLFLITFSRRGGAK